MKKPVPQYFNYDVLDYTTIEGLINIVNYHIRYYWEYCGLLGGDNMINLVDKSDFPLMKHLCCLETKMVATSQKCGTHF